MGALVAGVIGFSLLAVLFTAAVRSSARHRGEVTGRHLGSGWRADAGAVVTRGSQNTDGSESPRGRLRSQLHRRRCVVEDADDIPAGVMLAVRLRRVYSAASDYDAGGVNVAFAADNGVVIVHWIRVCHCMFPFYR